MDLTQVLVFLGLYLLLLPLTVRLIGLAHSKLVVQRAMERAQKSKMGMKNLPKKLWPRIKERVGFTMKDKRSVQMGKKTLGMTNKQMFFTLWGAGLLAFVAYPFVGLWWLVLLGVMLFYTSVIFGFFASKKLLAERKKVIERMYTIGKQKLSISAEFDENPGAVVSVLEWADYVRPQRVEFKFPDTFAAEGAEGFLRQYNQIFGTETTWVPADDPETGKPGWDFEAGKVTIYAVPPLPRMAPWKEHYITTPGIAWSFFPLALGVENGVELVNPETGEKENVLGFDLSGLQAKEGEKNGLKVSPTITTSPMALVAGGTGGGKALATTTLVKVLPPPKPLNTI